MNNNFFKPPPPIDQYDYRNDHRNSKINYQKPFKQAKFRSKPEYFSYQTIEQKPYKDVQLKIEDHDMIDKQWDKMPFYLDKPIDRKIKTMNKQHVKPKKLTGYSGLRKHEEIRRLEKVRHGLQMTKIRVQEQIEELKNLEYRCRRRKLYFFDTLWKNTANMLAQLDKDLDKQLCKVDNLLKEFSDAYDELDKIEELKKATTAPSYDYNDYNSMALMTANKNQIKKEKLENKLKEPRILLEDIQDHSAKLISVNKGRLDKIKIVVKDFKKEYKNKL